MQKDPFVCVWGGGRSGGGGMREGGHEDADDEEQESEADASVTRAYFKRMHGERKMKVIYYWATRVDVTG